VCLLAYWRKLLVWVDLFPHSSPSTVTPRLPPVDPAKLHVLGLVVAIVCSIILMARNFPLSLCFPCLPQGSDDEDIDHLWGQTIQSASKRQLTPT
jgi:hypothetical protein